MAIKESAIDETEDQRLEREEREQQESQRRQELEDARQKAHEADVARAKAEGEAAALRSQGQGQQQQQQAWTEEQWAAEAARREMTVPQLKSQVEIAKGIADISLAPLKSELEEARKAAREAKEESARLKSGKASEDARRQFYKENPAYSRHQEKVEEFLSAFPDAETAAPEVLKKRLDMAKNYVKGQVKEKFPVERQDGRTGSGRLEFNEREEHRGRHGEEEEPEEFDATGIENEGGADLMRRVHRGFGKDVSEETMKAWKSGQTSDGKGVGIGVDEDVQRARDVMKRR